LGISAVDVGEGNTANRATADNMSRNLVDGVKDFQSIMVAFFNHFVISELLLESTFGMDVLDPENMVRLYFKEIDIDAQIKKEAHVADQFAKQMVTLDEARIAQGREPILIPSTEDVENGNDTIEKFPDWNKMQWKLMQIPTLLIQSIDEPWSPAAKALAKGNSNPVTTSDLEESSDEQIDHEMELEKEKTKAKIAVAKAKPKPVVRKDSALVVSFENTKVNTLQYVERQQGRISSDWISSYIRLQMQPAIKSLIVDQMLSYRNGFSQYRPVNTEEFMQQAALARTHFTERSNLYIQRIINQVILTLQRNVDSMSSVTEWMHAVQSTFDSLAYRTHFVEDVEIRKAYNFGQAQAAKAAGFKRVHSMKHTDSQCASCNSFHDHSIEIEHLILDHVAPHHANCGCGIMFSSEVVESKETSGMITISVSSEVK
jgi:hypothetical protein